MKRPEMILCPDCGAMATFRAETRISLLYKCPKGHTTQHPKPVKEP